MRNQAVGVDRDAAGNRKLYYDQYGVLVAMNPYDSTTPEHEPEQLLADSHYGSTECLQKGRDRNVEIVAPAQTPKGKLQGKLTLEDFELDDDGRVTRCPAGHKPREISIAGIRLQVIFDKEVCAGKRPNNC